MPIVIVEIKARCDDHVHIRAYLESQNARFVGEDHQIDTYYRVRDGRLKLRQGKIENSLIYYHRDNQAAPKRSDVQLYKTTTDSGLGDLLASALDVWATVDKRREIWFIDNVKFHLDRVEGLGLFVEIEAISEDGSTTEDALRRQCTRYMDELEIPEEDLVTLSYSDLLNAAE